MPPGSWWVEVGELASGIEGRDHVFRFSYHPGGQTKEGISSLPIHMYIGPGSGGIIDKEKIPIKWILSVYHRRCKVVFFD